MASAVSTMTPPAASPAPNDKSQTKSRPEKPDEDKYKENLAKAEKEHSAAQEKLVSPPDQADHCLGVCQASCMTHINAE